MSSWNAETDKRVAPLPSRHAEGQHRANDRPGQPIERQAFVHQLGAFAEEIVRHEASGIERGVLEGADHTGPRVVGARRPRQAPARRRQDGRRRRASLLEAAVAVEPQRQRERRLAPSDGVIEDRRAVSHVRARPGPARKRALDRFGAGVLVEVPCPAPAQRRRLHLNRDTGLGSERPPPMTSLAFQEKGLAVDGFCPDFDPPANRARNRRRRLVDGEAQRADLPGRRRAADRKRVVRSPEVRSPSLGHRPGRAARAIESDIDGAVIERIAPPGPGVVGREDAADESDDRQAVSSIVADRVDVPPGIAAGLDFLVEARSRITQIAACRPDSAAIGIPGPG